MEKFRLDQKYADTPLWDLSDSNSMQQIEAVQNRGIIIIELIKKHLKIKDDFWTGTTQKQEQIAQFHTADQDTFRR